MDALSPVGKPEDVTSSTRAALLSRLERQPVVQVERWTRDNLYQREL